MEVEAIIHGLAANTRAVQLEPGFVDCYEGPKPGERWLILGRISGRTGGISTNICDGSFRIHPNHKMVQAMVQSFARGPNLLFGQIRLYKGWQSLWGINNLLPNVVVRFQGPGQTLTTKTGPDGMFQFTGIPAGDYRLEVISPGLSPERRSDTDDGSREYTIPDIIHMPGGGCVEQPVMLWPDQHIAGTVTDRLGRPVEGLPVHACTLDQTGHPRSAERKALTGPDGRYVLPRLLAGTYVVTINVDRRPGLHPCISSPPPFAFPKLLAPVKVTAHSVDKVDFRMP